MMNEQKNANGTSQACASCKYQRRKCQRDCFLAPFFPANRGEDFYNVHKLFGVSNVVKILNSIPAEDRLSAVETIVYQAKRRKEDPVHGCYGIVKKLRAQIEHDKNELYVINQQLAFCRQRDQIQQQQQQQVECILAASTAASSVPLLQQLGNFNFQSSSPSYLDLANEISNLGEMKNIDMGYSYYPTLHEYEDLKPAFDMKPTFDVKTINAVGNPYDNIKIITNNGKDSDESSAESTAKERQAL